MSEVNTPVDYSLKWDSDGERYYHTGVSKGVIYKYDDTNGYKPGVAWNGLISVEDNPDGADVTDLWADNMKYASFRSKENAKGTIKAYMWPEAFNECNGKRTFLGGMHVGQQSRKTFGLCYRTEVGSDTDPEAGYTLHLVYGATASPSSMTHDTVNDNPSAAEPSWDYECTPVAVEELTGVKQTSTIDICSLDFAAAKRDAIMAAIEDALYGGTEQPYLPLPDDLYEIISTAST